MPKMFYDDCLLFQFSVMLSIAVGYAASIILSIFCVPVTLSFAKYFKIKEKKEIIILRFITLGLLLAAPACFFTGRPYMKFILVPIYTIFTLGIDFLLSMMILKTYTKKTLFKFVLFSNFAILIPSIIIASILPYILFVFY